MSQFALIRANDSYQIVLLSSKLYPSPIYACDPYAYISYRLSSGSSPLDVEYAVSIAKDIANAIG